MGLIRGREPDVDLEIVYSLVHPVFHRENLVAEDFGDPDLGSKGQEVAGHDAVPGCSTGGGDKRSVVGFLGRAGIGGNDDRDRL